MIADFNCHTTALEINEQNNLAVNECCCSVEGGFSFIQLFELPSFYVRNMSNNKTHSVGFDFGSIVKIRLNKLSPGLCL